MKKIVILLLASALAVSALAACGGGDGETSGEETSVVSAAESGAETSVVSESVSSGESAAANEVDFSALAEKLAADFVTQERRLVSGDDVFQETGISPDSYTGFLWLADLSGLSSEKAVVFLAKDEAAAEDIKTRLDTVLQSETAQMKDYNAENYAMLQKAAAGREGLYVYLIISPNVDKLAETVTGAF